MFYNYYTTNAQEQANKIIETAKAFARTLTQEQLKERIEELSYQKSNITYRLYCNAYETVYNERA